jgi:hypothetical protein
MPSRADALGGGWRAVGSAAAGPLSLPVLDAGLAVAAAAITIAIGVTPERGAPREVFGYALGLVLAALVLVRRRLAVPALSVATLQPYVGEQVRRPVDGGAGPGHTRSARSPASRRGPGGAVGRAARPPSSAWLPTASPQLTPAMGRPPPAPDGLWPAARPVGLPCIHDLLVRRHRRRTEGDR